MLSLQMALLGIPTAIYPVIGLALYPVEVRASGYNLAHNIVMGLLGGLSPMTITSMELSPSFYGSRESVYTIVVWMAAAGGASLVGCAVAWWRQPQANYTTYLWDVKRQKEENHRAVSAAIHDIDVQFKNIW